MAERGGVQYLKDCSDGWKCPVCRRCFERHTAYSHLKREHPDAHAQATAAARTKSPLARWLPREADG